MPQHYFFTHPVEILPKSSGHINPHRPEAPNKIIAVPVFNKKINAVPFSKKNKNKRSPSPDRSPSRSYISSTQRPATPVPKHHCLSLPSHHITTTIK